jgi:hypothetical protein
MALKPSKPPASKASKAAKAEVIPPAMTDELFDEILDRIANGSSLLRLEKEGGFPARSTMWKFINGTEDRRAAYEQARQDRADYRVEMMDGIVGQIHAGKIEPNAGRVMIDALKWQASKEKPKSYGDKLEHVGSGTTVNVNMIQKANLDEFTRRIAGIASRREEIAPFIDGDGEADGS